MLFARLLAYAPVHVKMGMLFPTNISSGVAFNNSAGAALIAIDRIYQENLLPNGSTIELFYKIEECIGKTSIGYALEFAAQNLYDVIVGSPSCINGDELEGDVATFYNVNLLLWGATTHSILLGSYYPTALGAIDTYRDSAKAIQTMMITLSWEMFSLIYTQEESCTYFVEELDTLTTSTNKIRIAFKKPITNFINDDVTFILDQIKLNSRIVVLCMEDMSIYRTFADAVHKAGMDTDEYVYILRTTVKRLADLETNPIYGNDASAKLVASKTFLASDFAPTLHDTIYLYAYALSNAINKSGNSDVVHNGTYVAADNDFNAVTGVNGNIKMGRDGFRKANYLISSYNDAGHLASYLSFQLYQYTDNITGSTADGVNTTKLFTDPTTSIWANHGGVQPTSTPKCGFDGLGCPIDAFVEYRGIFIAVIILGCAIAIASNASSSQYSIASKNLQSLPIYIYRQEKVIGIKHEATTRLDESEMAELRQMRTLDHDNINRFIGLSIDGPAIISVWKYCSRGNLQDIMSNSTITMDGFFIYSIIRDLAEVRTVVENGASPGPVSWGSIGAQTHYFEGSGYGADPFSQGPENGYS
uniref:Guanylate cyclase n=1 Tax=Acrobeloides nanus TaxID=290746 RepID=A0A914DRA4_9BILA